MKSNTQTILLVLILAGVIGLYFYRPKESFLYGGPYEQAQDTLCGQFDTAASRKKCMCDKKDDILKQCKSICVDPAADCVKGCQPNDKQCIQSCTLPPEAANYCKKACQPIENLDPCT